MKIRMLIFLAVISFVIFSDRFGTKGRPDLAQTPTLAVLADEIKAAGIKNCAGWIQSGHIEVCQLKSVPDIKLIDMRLQQAGWRQSSRQGGIGTELFGAWCSSKGGIYLFKDYEIRIRFSSRPRDRCE
jgi:hypothetical protein